MTAIFSAKRVFVGDGTVIGRGAVAVRGSAIAAVGPAGDIERLDGIDRRYDLGEGSLLPGLIDSHVHLGFDGSDAPVEHMKASTDGQLQGIFVCATTNVRTVNPSIGGLSGRPVHPGMLEGHEERIRMMYEAGKDADLAGTRGDPSADLTTLRDPEVVVARGAVLERRVFSRHERKEGERA